MSQFDCENGKLNATSYYRQVSVKYTYTYIYVCVYVSVLCANILQREPERLVARRDMCK